MINSSSKKIDREIEVWGGTLQIFNTDTLINKDNLHIRIFVLSVLC